MTTVYLAGPITGLTYAGSTDWRRYMIDKFARIGVKALSPMRGKEYLAQLKGTISGTGEEYAHLGVLSLSRGVMTRDRFDATRCDVLLVNFLGARNISIGSSGCGSEHAGSELDGSSDSRRKNHRVRRMALFTVLREHCRDDVVQCRT